MKIAKRTIFDLLVLFLAVGIIYFLAVQSKNIDVRVDRRGIHATDVFFDQKLFDQSTAEQNQQPNKKIKGGVIPHHLLASNLIADFYSRLPQETIKTIFLIGPNHEEKGAFFSLSSLFEWDTPFGFVEPDEKIINDLVAKGVIQIDENVLETEHSVGNHFAFIKYYLPNVKVVPIIFSENVGQKEIKFVVDNLKDYLAQEGNIMIASIDFSHYLTEGQAEKNDQESLAAMQDFNYQQLLSYGNEHLDSSTSIIAMLMSMNEVGVDDFEVLYNTNSAKILGYDNLETTSYFSLIFQNR